jgi:endoglucanase
MPTAAIDVLKQMQQRTMSNPQAQPMTGAELGSGQQMSGAGASMPEAAMAGQKGGAGAGGSSGAGGGTTGGAGGGSTSSGKPSAKKKGDSA